MRMDSKERKQLGWIDKSREELLEAPSQINSRKHKKIFDTPKLEGISKIQILESKIVR